MKIDELLAKGKLKSSEGYIYMCASCGDRVGKKGKYCGNCTTPTQRAAIITANKEIKKENVAKGFRYAS